MIVKRFRKLFRPRTPSFESNLKLPWHLRLIVPAKRFVRKATSNFFSFHTPKWTSTLSSVVKPPTGAITRAQLFNPIYWVSWCLRFFWSWLISRPYASVGPAIPAIIIAAVLGGMYVEMRLRGTRYKKTDYRTALGRAIESKDYETALVAVGALTDLDPFDLTNRFQRALIENEKGNKEDAKEQMLRLATGKRMGEAALWLVVNTLDLKHMADWTPVEHEHFNEWTEIALGSPDTKHNLPAKTLKATYLIGIGATNEALRYLSELVPSNPEFALTAAAICKQNGNLQQSQYFAAEARNYLDAKLKQSPSDREVRIALAKSLLLLNQEHGASELLMDGFNVSQQRDQGLRIASAEALVAYMTRLSSESSTPERLMKRLETLQEARRIAPDSPLVNDALISILFECRDNKNQEVLTLRTALVKGIDSESAHFIRGTLALLNRDFAEAKLHLELAGNKDDQPGVLNNLAVAMYQSESPELENALVFVNAALEKVPDHPYFRETRGQILLKLNRTREAIPDLEFSLRAPELVGESHKALAIAYDAIGQKELAQDHRDLAELAELQKKKKK